jgi:hypothetical protein
MCHHDSDVSSSLAEGGCEHCAVRPAHAPSPSTRAQHYGGNRSGRRVRRSGGSGAGSAASRETKNSGCASSRDFPSRRRRSTHHQERKRRMKATGGWPLPRGGSLRPPHRELRRRRRIKRLGQARKRPPLGGLRRRWCMLQRCRHVRQRVLGARRWRRRPRPWRLSSPRGRGSGASPP